MTDDLVAEGKAIVASGKHTPPRGEYLGRLYGVLDVYEGSPQEWRDTLQQRLDGIAVGKSVITPTKISSLMWNSYGY